MSTPINLRAFRGDTKSINIVIEENDEPVNISTWVVFFTLKEKETDSDDDAVLEKSVGPGQATAHSNPTAGQTLITLTASETNALEGKYHYDLQYKKGDNTITTFVKGEFVFDRDVTRRTA